MTGVCRRTFITECSFDTGDDSAYWKYRLKELSKDGGVFGESNEMFLVNGDSEENEVVLQAVLLKASTP